MADKVLINLATGLEDAERVTVAFLVAGAALERGREVAIFLTKEAVRLAEPGHAVGIACDGCPPLERLFAQFARGRRRAAGVPVLRQRAPARPRWLRGQRPRGRRHADVRLAGRRGRPGLQLLTVALPRRVAVVEHQRVAVGVGEEGHVADAGVERVAGERHAALGRASRAPARRRRRAARCGWRWA